MVGDDASGRHGLGSVVWRPLACVLAFAAGCGRVGFDLRGDAGGDTSSPVDGEGVDTAVLGPFSTPTEVTELNAGAINTEDPSVTDDLLEIVFSSTRTGSALVDVWTATRASSSDPWGTPVQVAGINSANDDTTPEISGDGLVLIFASNRTGTAGLYDLYQVTRASRGAAWSAPQRIVELASSADEFTGSLAPDLLRVVFASSRTGGVGAGDIYEAVRATTAATWGAPMLLSLDSVDDDSAPWMSADARTLYFGTTRPGGQGLADVWTATRATPADPWSAPIPVTELNGPDTDSDPWLSPDGHTIFYSRQSGSTRTIHTANR